MAYTSRYTGLEIDTAVGAYKDGAVRALSIIDINESNWYGDSAPYKIKIGAAGTLTFGNYPNIFIVDNNGEKIIPDVIYPNNNPSSTVPNDTFIIKSNKKINGKLIMYGAIASTSYVPKAYQNASST